MIFNVAAFLAFVAMTAPASEATITGSTGNAIMRGSAEGHDLDNYGTEHAKVQGFDEIQDVNVLDGEITVDLLVGDNLAVGGAFTGKTAFNAANGRDLPTGSYSSHVIHYDPPGSASATVYTATFTFDSDIKGIILTNAGDAKLLNGSDGTFGNADDYDTAAQRRADTGGGLDSFELQSSNTLKIVQMKTGSGYIDNVRVLTEATCSSPRRRRAWRDASCADRSFFLDAVQDLKALSDINTLGIPNFDRFSTMHHSNGAFAHNGSPFLPWHRWYIYKFEEALQTVSGRCVTVPYWDWERDSGNEANSPVLDAATLGSATGFDSSTHCVTEGIASSWASTERTGGCLER